MHYPHLCGLFFNQPLALLPAKAEEIAAFLRAKRRGEPISREEIRAAVERRRQTPASNRSGNVAIIPIMGIVAQRVSLLEESSGGVSTQAIGAAVEEAVADKEVASIVLLVDSPGGSVAGLTELASTIRAARGRKPVYALADHMAASAAYWLAAQATELWVAPSGTVGSIGVISVHESHAKALEKDGVEVSIIHAGDYKAEGNPYQPLTAEARADLQSKVNSYYGDFTRDVAAGRRTTVGTVRGDAFARGRMVLADDAVRRGMADKVGTFAELLGRARSGGAPSAASAASYAPRIAATGRAPAAVAARARLVEIEEGR